MCVSYCVEADKLRAEGHLVALTVIVNVNVNVTVNVIVNASVTVNVNRWTSQ